MKNKQDTGNSSCSDSGLKLQQGHQSSGEKGNTSDTQEAPCSQTGTPCRDRQVQGFPVPMDIRRGKNG